MTAKKLKQWISKLVHTLVATSPKDENPQEPYIEKPTVCDGCEYFNRCLNDGRLLEITTLCDTQKHYIFDFDGCQKWRYVNE